MLEVTQVGHTQLPSIRIRSARSRAQGWEGATTNRPWWKSSIDVPEPGAGEHSGGSGNISAPDETKVAQPPDDPAPARGTLHREKRGPRTPPAAGPARHR